MLGRVSCLDLWAVVKIHFQKQMDCLFFPISHSSLHNGDLVNIYKLFVFKGAGCSSSSSGDPPSAGSGIWASSDVAFLSNTLIRGVVEKVWSRALSLLEFKPWPCWVRISPDKIPDRVQDSRIKSGLSLPSCRTSVRLKGYSCLQWTGSEDGPKERCPSLPVPSVCWGGVCFPLRA